MKTLVRLAGAALFAGSSFAAALPGQAADPDFSLIQKLPEREIAAKQAAHVGWDSNLPNKMLAATAAYNDALAGMASDLAATYYGPVKLNKEDVAAYVKTLKAAAEFRHRLDNPTNEPPDSLDALEAPSVVSNDLEDTIEQMVEAVSGESDKFDFAGWEKRWETARKTGDKPEQAEPLPKVGDKGAAAPTATPQGTPTGKRDKPD